MLWNVSGVVGMVMYCLFLLIFYDLWLIELSRMYERDIICIVVCRML